MTTDGAAIEEAIDDLDEIISTDYDFSRDEAKDWLSDHVGTVRAVLEAALKQEPIDVEGLILSTYPKEGGSYNKEEYGRRVGWNQAINHLTKHYEFRKRVQGG